MLDDLDTRLITELQKDATVAHAELARRLGTSKTTVTRRIQRMVRQGVIKIVAWADPEKLGLHVSALIGLKVDPGQVERVTELLAALPSVNLAAALAGRFDVMVGVAFPSIKELSNFTLRELSAINGIRESETLVALEVKKQPRIALT